MSFICSTISTYADRLLKRTGDSLSPKEYATVGPPMIVDDVYTTGTSFKEYCKEHYQSKSFDYNPKWVAFARTEPKDRSGVRALFTMPYRLEQ